MSQEGTHRSENPRLTKEDELHRSTPRWLLFFVLGMFAVLVLMEVSRCSGEAGELEPEPEPPTSPCVDQADAECVLATVETSSYQNFRSYIYCACVTTDGKAKGFVAARRVLVDRALRDGHENERQK